MAPTTRCSNLNYKRTRTDTGPLLAHSSLPSSSTLSRAVTSCAGVPITSPFTVTRPAAMSPSACRRLQTPEPAMRFAIRIAATPAITTGRTPRTRQQRDTKRIWVLPAAGPRRWQTTVSPVPSPGCSLFHNGLQTQTRIAKAVPPYRPWRPTRQTTAASATQLCRATTSAAAALTGHCRHGFQLLLQAAHLCGEERTRRRRHGVPPASA